MEKEKNTEIKKTVTKKSTAKKTNSKSTTTKKVATKKPASRKKNLTKPAVKTTKVTTPTAKVTKKVVKDEVVKNTNPEVELTKSIQHVNKSKRMPDIKRPQPKPRTFTKEEKVQFKKLSEAFTYVANLTTVIEEKTMDLKQIPDLTISELHVIETVHNNNNKPMTIIANKLNVTVGSLITCVNRLIQKDYLVRTRDEMDHRVILLSVTPKAKKVIKVHDKFHQDILYMVLEGVSLTSATKVMTQFETVLDNYMNPKEEKKVRK